VYIYILCALAHNIIQGRAGDEFTHIHNTYYNIYIGILGYIDVSEHNSFPRPPIPHAQLRRYSLKCIITLCCARVEKNHIFLAWPSCIDPQLLIYGERWFINNGCRPIMVNMG